MLHEHNTLLQFKTTDTKDEKGTQVACFERHIVPEKGMALPPRIKSGM